MSHWDEVIQILRKSKIEVGRETEFSEEQLACTGYMEAIDLRMKRLLAEDLFFVLESRDAIVCRKRPTLRGELRSRSGQGYFLTEVQMKIITEAMGVRL